jgi:opacity protein-like surface antigen
MKMRRMVWAVILVGAMTMSAWANSAHLGGNIGVGAANDNVDEGLALQGYLELDVATNVALRGTALYFGGDTKVDVLSDGEFTMLGIEGSLVFKFPSKGVTPYIGAGLGYYLPESELSDDAEAVLAYMGLRGEDDLQPGAGFHAMGGVAFDLAPNVSLDLNVKYVYFKTDDDAKVTNLYTFQSITVTEEVDLSTLFATAGLKFTF